MLRRYVQVARDLFDRLPLDQMLTSYPADRLHNQHPPPPTSNRSRQHTSHNSGGQFWTPIPRLTGSKLHAETQARRWAFCPSAIIEALWHMIYAHNEAESVAKFIDVSGGAVIPKLSPPAGTVGP